MVLRVRPAFRREMEQEKGDHHVYDHKLLGAAAARQDELTKSGRAVADYLVHHADEAQYLSISSLARECKVAEATVFRFCRALGFEGYHEMRISLAQANATGALVNQHEPEPGATTASCVSTPAACFSLPSTAPRILFRPKPWSRLWI